MPPTQILSEDMMSSHSMIANFSFLFQKFLKCFALALSRSFLRSNLEISEDGLFTSYITYSTYWEKASWYKLVPFNFGSKIPQFSKNCFFFQAAKFRFRIGPKSEKTAGEKYLNVFGMSQLKFLIVTFYLLLICEKFLPLV